MALITSKDVKPNENAVYYFKKSIFINDIQKSTVNIFAEARYKLYINGRLAAIGPLRQTSEIKYYDTVDITGYLKPGENLFEISVLQLENNLFSAERKHLESVIRSGNMALCLWGNAGDAEISTDESYLCAKEENLSFFFEPEYEFYNAVGLCERAGADYKKNLSFKNAVPGQDVYSLSTEESFSLEIPLPLKKRPIPMMYFKETAFKSENAGIYDAGGLTCGYVRLKASGKGQIKITYAESMVFLEDGKIVKRKRDASDGVIIGHFDLLEVDGDLNFEPFWMRTFRFIKVETSGDVKIEGFDYLETGYPIEIADGYDFGSDIDNKLFKISANTLKRCMHETYVDCPYYEQLQYAMDTHLQILYTYQLTGDRALAEKAIDDFAQSYRAGFITQSRYPTGKSQYIPGFSLFFIFMLYHYIMFAVFVKYADLYLFTVTAVLNVIKLYFTYSAFTNCPSAACIIITVNGFCIVVTQKSRLMPCSRHTSEICVGIIISFIKIRKTFNHYAVYTVIMIICPRDGYFNVLLFFNLKSIQLNKSAFFIGIIMIQ